MSRCRCSYCMNGRKDFTRGGVDEKDFEPDFRHVRLKKKSRKFCPKEKGQIACQELVKVVDWRYYNKQQERWRESGHYECVKCHRHQRLWFQW